MRRITVFFHGETTDTPADTPTEEGTLEKYAEQMLRAHVDFGANIMRQMWLGALNIPDWPAPTRKRKPWRVRQQARLRRWLRDYTPRVHLGPCRDDHDGCY